MKRTIQLSAAIVLVLAVVACNNLPGVAPAAPGGVTATAVTTGDGLVSVSWNSVSGASSYNLYWASGATVATASGTKLAGATSPAVVNNIPQGTQYSFVVTAVNSGGESAASTAAQCTLPTTTSHVYATGEIGGYPVYWKDGVAYPLGTVQSYSGGQITASSTGGIYVAVYDFRTATKAAAFWNNGTMVSLPVPTSTTFKFFGGIALSGTDVYISGTVLDSNGNQQPVFWKNGLLTALSDGADTQGYAGEIAVSAGGVDIAGSTSTPSQDGNIVAWVNDSATPTVLNQGAGNGYGWISTLPGTGAVVVSGSNVYEYGTTYTSQGGEPAYWQGSLTANVLGTAGTGVDYLGLAMAVNGTDLYFAGAAQQQQPNNAQGVPVYWKNGTMASLPLPASVAVGSATYIDVIGSDVYVAGDEAMSYYDSADTAIPLYWKDGALVSLPLPSGDVNAKLQGMEASGTDNYIVATTGTYSPSQGNIDYTVANHPVYWKDGNMNEFPLETYTSGFVNGMFVAPY